MRSDSITIEVRFHIGSESGHKPFGVSHLRI
jgi:hypothetical protein